MTKVIQQPASSAQAQENYAETIEKGVPLERLEEHLDAEAIDRIRDNLEGDDPHIGVWGVRGTPDSRKVSDWERIDPGDIVLFAANNEIFASGLTLATVHSPSLARKLWGEDGEGKTWEWIYLLGEVESRSIPYREYNRAVGYAENNRIQVLIGLCQLT